MSVAVIKPITKGVTKDVYDTVKESLSKDVKDVDWKTVRNYSLLTIGFSVTGYLMYKYRSSIYPSIESMVYTKEERIHRRMVEWNRSDKCVEDDKRFCQALITEISTGSDLSWEFMKNFINFLNVNKESFGPHITIFDFCKCVENRKDYSENVWYLLLFMSTMVDGNSSARGMNDPLLISARDILHNILRDLPAEAADNKVLLIAKMYKFICIYNDPASYRVYFPEHVWDRIMATHESLSKDVKDVDWKTVRNYSLLTIGFPVTGYLMYKYRSSIYSSIESMVYTKEERIHKKSPIPARSIDATKAGAPVQDANGNVDAFIIAAEKEYITDVGGIVDAKNKGVYTALSACHKEDLKVVRYLLFKRADVNAKDNVKYDKQSTSTLTSNSAVTSPEVKSPIPARSIDATKAEAPVQDAYGDVDAFIRAAENGELQKVKEYIDGGGKVDAKNKGGYTALMLACHEGNSEVAQYLVTIGADVNAKNKGGYTALMLACHKGNSEVAQYLISKGADVNAKDNRGFTPLMLACKRANEEITKELITKGADVHATNNEGLSALMNACESGSLRIVLILFEKNPDVNAKKKSGMTALMGACAGGHLSVVKELVNRGADIDATDNDQLDVYSYAEKSKRTAVVDYLKSLKKEKPMASSSSSTSNTKIYPSLEKKQSPPTPTSNSAVTSPEVDAYGIVDAFIRAAENGELQKVKEYIVGGGKVDAKNKGGYTALMLACHKGNSEVAQYLISKGADVNDKDNRGFTPLMLACKRANEEITKELITKGADVHASNNEGLTALMNACESGSRRIVLILFEKYPDVNAKKKSGMTALIGACAGGHLSVVKELVNQGADIDATNNSGMTALMGACEGGHFSVVKELVENRGADIDATDNDQHDAYSYADKWKRTKVMEYLRSMKKIKTMEDIRPYRRKLQEYIDDKILKCVTSFEFYYDKNDKPHISLSIDQEANLDNEIEEDKKLVKRELSEFGLEMKDINIHFKLSSCDFQPAMLSKQHDYKPTDDEPTDDKSTDEKLTDDKLAKEDKDYYVPAAFKSNLGNTNTCDLSSGRNSSRGLVIKLKPDKFKGLEKIFPDLDTTKGIYAIVGASHTVPRILNLSSSFFDSDLIAHELNVAGQSFNVLNKKSHLYNDLDIFVIQNKNFLGSSIQFEALNTFNETFTDLNGQNEKLEGYITHVWSGGIKNKVLEIDDTVYFLGELSKSYGTVTAFPIKFVGNINKEHFMIKCKLKVKQGDSGGLLFKRNQASSTNAEEFIAVGICSYFKGDESYFVPLTDLDESIYELPLTIPSTRTIPSTPSHIKGTMKKVHQYRRTLQKYIDDKTLKCFKSFEFYYDSNVKPHISLSIINLVTYNEIEEDKKVVTRKLSEFNLTEEEICIVYELSSDFQLAMLPQVSEQDDDKPANEGISTSNLADYFLCNRGTCSRGLVIKLNLDKFKDLKKIIPKLDTTKEIYAIVGASHTVPRILKLDLSSSNVFLRLVRSNFICTELNVAGQSFNVRNYEIHKFTDLEIFVIQNKNFLGSSIQFEALNTFNETFTDLNGQKEKLEGYITHVWSGDVNTVLKEGDTVYFLGQHNKSKGTFETLTTRGVEHSMIKCKLRIQRGDSGGVLFKRNQASSTNAEEFIAVGICSYLTRIKDKIYGDESYFVPLTDLDESIYELPLSLDGDDDELW